jgi:hypothetical protein
MKPSPSGDLRVQSTTSNTSTIPQSPASGSELSKLTPKVTPTVFSADAPHQKPPIVPPRRPSLASRLQETMSGSFGFDEYDDDD